jgi:uncharacterized protein involved in exopolysaccharide biosynthesis
MFKRFWWVFLVMAAVGAMAGLMASAVVAYVMPKKYESQVTIEVKPRIVIWSAEANDVAGSSSPKPEQPMTPQFFGTEFEKIKSSNSLAKVVDNLELGNKWGVDKETAIRILKGIVNTQNIRGTHLIWIKVRHTNREDARDIAAEVARAYKEYRAEIEGQDTDSIVSELKRAAGDQADRMEELRKLLARTPDPQASDANYVDLKRDYEAAKQRSQELDLRVTNEAMAATLSQGSVVVHEEPQIAQTPISPNVPLVLMSGIAGGFLLSPLLAFPLIWFLDRRNPVRVESGAPPLP